MRRSANLLAPKRNAGIGHKAPPLAPLPLAFLILIKTFPFLALRLRAAGAPRWKRTRTPPRPYGLRPWAPASSGAPSATRPRLPHLPLLLLLLLSWFGLWLFKVIEFIEVLHKVLVKAYCIPIPVHTVRSECT